MVWSRSLALLPGRGPLWPLLATAMFAAGCAGRPVLELHEAREAVSTARDFEADIYAPEAFETAVFNLEGAEYAIADADEAPFWSRDYTLAIEFLALAVEQAGRAQAEAGANKAAVFEQVETRLPAARIAFQSAFEAVEAARAERITSRQLQPFEDELAAVFGTLNDAEALYEQGDYVGALVLLEEVAQSAAVLEARARQAGGL